MTLILAKFNGSQLSSAHVRYVTLSAIIIKTCLTVKYFVQVDHLSVYLAMISKILHNNIIYRL